MLAALWLAILMGMLAVGPFVAFGFGAWLSYEPPNLIRWLVAIGVPLVLAASSCWLRAAFIWTVGLVPVGLAFVVNFAVLFLIWLPSVALWLIKNPVALALLLAGWLADYFLLDVNGILQLLIGVGIFIVVLRAFGLKENPPAFGPTRR